MGTITSTEAMAPETRSSAGTEQIPAPKGSSTPRAHKTSELRPQPLVSQGRDVDPGILDRDSRQRKGRPHEAVGVRSAERFRGPNGRLGGRHHDHGSGTAVALVDK